MLIYKRDSSRILNVKEECSTGVKNGDELRLRHIFYLIFFSLGMGLTFILKSDTAEQKNLTELTVDILYIIFLGGVSSRIGIVTGFLTLSLHNHLWTQTDHTKLKYCVVGVVVGGLIVAVLHDIFIPITQRNDESFIFSPHFINSAYFLWSVVPFLFSLYLIKKDPWGYINQT